MRRALLYAPLLLFVFAPVSANAQTRDLTLPIVESDPAQSPIRGSGQYFFHEITDAKETRTQYAFDLKLTSVSAVPILAYEVRLEAMPDMGAGFHFVDQNDYFFRPDLTFIPGAQESDHVGFGPVEHLPFQRGIRPAPRKPYATFKVLFVQFADGSTWGHSNWGNDLHAARAATMARFQELLRPANSNDQSAFSAAISADMAQPGIIRYTFAELGALKYILESKGTQAAISKIQTSLEMAQERKQIM